MAITDKTRKRLWAKSGNRCAISKIELVFDPANIKDESIIGDECHIYARNLGGPRYNPDITDNAVDDYENLILLSKNYHKVIDDNPGYYSADKLKDIKRIHEAWVRDTLDFEIRNVKSKKDKDVEFPFLSRVHTGSEIFNMVSTAHAYDFDNDDLKEDSEVELVGGFLQLLQDCGDIYSDMESGERVRIKHEISKELKELEDNGFWIFGGLSKRKPILNGKVTVFNIVTLRVLRSNNPSIIVINFDKETARNESTEHANQPDAE